MLSSRNSVFYRLTLLGVGLLSMARPLAAGDAPRVFRAGAATSNVTPPLGSSINGGFQDLTALQIHDELHARCLALDDGSTKLVLVTVDNCLIQRAVFDDAKRQVQRSTGLPMENMLMSATHSHSCGTLTPVGQSEPDPAYQKFVANRIADGVRRALNNLAPARIGWGHGEVPQHVFNRRWFLKPGTVPRDPFGGTTDQVKMNPGVGNPNLDRPAGPTDPQVWFVSVQSIDGRPLAVYANYSLHYVGGVGPGHISADYFGAFAERLGEVLGASRQDPPFVGLMANGTSGDINNVNFRGEPGRKPPYAQIRLVANDVAQEVARVSRTLTYADWVPLGVAQRDVSLGLRLPTADEVARARVIMSGSKAFPRMVTSEESYARETVLLADFPAQVAAPLQVLKIGGLRIAAIPAEVFVEIGLELKRRYPESFTVSLANGYHGYMPTPAQHRLGGYETWRARSACLEVEASTKVVAGLGGLFDQLK
ncbi:MAG: hypothetical protein WCQ89_13085 [Verrucomicrobiota bacterium]